MRALLFALLLLGCTEDCPEPNPGALCGKATEDAGTKGDAMSELPCEFKACPFKAAHSIDVADRREDGTFSDPVTLFYHACEDHTRRLVDEEHARGNRPEAKPPRRNPYQYDEVEVANAIDKAIDKASALDERDASGRKETK